MNQKERKVARDYLTRRKRNLLSQGASPKEVKAFLGGRWNFAGMSDKALSRAYNEIKGKGRTKVVNNFIYSADYVAKSKAWYGKKFAEQKLSQGLRKSLRSNLNNFASVNDIKAYKKSQDLRAKERYISALEDMYERTERPLNKSEVKKFNSMVSRIRRMSATNFSEFLTGGASAKVSFDNVMVFIDTDGSDTAFDFSGNLANEILDNVDNFSKQYINSKRRNRKK